MPSWIDARPTLALSVTPSTGFGSASITVTGICCPCSLKIWVMPSFFPMIPTIWNSLSPRSHWPPRGVIQLDCGRTHSRSKVLALRSQQFPGPKTSDPRPRSVWPPWGGTTRAEANRLQRALHCLDLDIHTGGKIELRQRVDRLGAAVEDVDHTLVRLQFELLARLLVDVRRTEDRPALRLRRERNRTGLLRARLLCRPHDVGRGLFDNCVIYCLEQDTNSACHNRDLC